MTDVKRLIAGADVDKAKTDDGATPLLSATHNGHLPVVERLIKAGAEVNKATPSSPPEPRRAPPTKRSNDEGVLQWKRYRELATPLHSARRAISNKPTRREG